MKKIKISTSCEPYMYTTNNDMSKLKIGDVLDVKFQNKHKVREIYKGKKVKFIVNNTLKYDWYGSYYRIAIVPLEKKDKFTEKDSIIVDVADRYESLMIDLYPCNRRPFAGWRNKTVNIKKIDHIRMKTKVPFTFNNVKVNGSGRWVHVDGLSWVSGINGGQHIDTYKIIRDVEYLDVEMVGYSYKKDELDKAISDNKYMEHGFWDFLNVEFKYEKETRRAFGIFVKELSEEFHERLNILIKWCANYALHNKYEKWRDENGGYAAFDVLRKNTDNPYFEELLDTYSDKDRNTIINNVLERCHHVKERGY